MPVLTHPVGRLIALIAAVVGLVAVIIGDPADAELLWGCVFVALGGLALS